MSLQTSNCLKSAAVAAAAAAGESVEQVIIDFVAATLITDNSDPAHVEGMTFAAGIQEAMLHRMN